MNHSIFEKVVIIMVISFSRLRTKFTKIPMRFVIDMKTTFDLVTYHKLSQVFFFVTTNTNRLVKSMLLSGLILLSVYANELTGYYAGTYRFIYR